MDEKEFWVRLNMTNKYALMWPSSQVWLTWTCQGI